MPRRTGNETPPQKSHGANNGALVAVLFSGAVTAVTVTTAAAQQAVAVCRGVRQVVTPRSRVAGFFGIAARLVKVMPAVWSALSGGIGARLHLSALPGVTAVAFSSRPALQEILICVNHRYGSLYHKLDGQIKFRTSRLAPVILSAHLPTPK
ncbi:MAG: hypothetical protein OXU41_01240 [Gammaproteobacteria bacterium]|nr:hypothetical protein [Gammaproteobacteria bacterium]